MTGTQTLKIYDVLQRYFKNDADAKAVVQEIEIIIDNKFEFNRDNFSSKTEVGLLRKVVETLKIELKAQIENSSLRVESNLKSEINKLIIWIIGIIFTAAMVFFALSKYIH